MSLKSLVPVALAVLLAGGAAAGAPRRERYPLEVTGRPVVYGHEPFTYLCIEAVDGTVYYVHPDQQQELRTLPPKLYVFYGRLHLGPLPTIEAARHPAGTMVVERWEETVER